MTVRELIERLQGLSDRVQDLDVVVDGCDCAGEIDRLAILTSDLRSDQGPEAVIIVRRNGWFDHELRFG